MRFFTLAVATGLALAAGLWWSAPSARADCGLPSAPEIHTLTPLHQRLRVGVTAKATPVPALTLSLESSRELCTANTLTELSWTITGGIPPYTLTIEGEKVDPSAESHLVNCGPMPSEPLTGDPLPEPKRRFTAVVTDARSIPTAVSQQIEVKLAAPLPAPSGSYMVPEATMFSVHWDWHRRSSDDGAVTVEPWYAVRWRQAESAAWTYSHVEAPRGVTQAGIAFIRDISDGEMYEAQIAELRHPIEIETSVALIWTDTLTTTTFTSPSGLSATATHDMITVQWNRQTHVDTYLVSLIAPKGRVDVIPTIDTDTTDSHQITIGHLHPDTTYTVRVVNLQGQGELGTVDHNTETSIRTQPAPTGWTPLPRGPQNLRATATHDSIRVDWDHPFEHTDGRYHAYRVALWHPESPYPRLSYAEPNATSFVFTKLQPGVTYRAVIKGGGLVRTDREISVTTPQTPSPANQPPRNQGQGGILGEVPIPGWPLLKPDFAWPLEFGLERRMTTYPWIWRGNDQSWHTAMNAGDGPTPTLTSPKEGRYSPHTAEAIPAPALTLSLESSRQLCTANTLTELSWKITGGVPPYTLTIEGEKVDPSAESHLVNCGPLLIDPQTEEPLPNQSKTFTAIVADARGVVATAEAVVVPVALPPRSPTEAARSSLYRNHLPAGSYRFSEYVGSIDAPSLVIDIPASKHRIKWESALLWHAQSPPYSGVAICVSDMSEQSVLCLDQGSAEVGYRHVAESPDETESVSISDVFDYIVASARLSAAAP